MTPRKKKQDFVKEAENILKNLEKIEKDQKIMEEAEQFQRKIGSVTSSTLLKEFNI